MGVICTQMHSKLYGQNYVDTYSMYISTWSKIHPASGKGPPKSTVDGLVRDVEFTAPPTSEWQYVV